jgi:Tetrapyrrole (Corrin/Porphyrin) Methylases
MKKGVTSNENEELDGFLKKKSIFSVKESTEESIKKKSDKNQVFPLGVIKKQEIPPQETPCSPTSGTLSIVSTPIGNLEDITLRALRILKEADIVACEDTRTTGHLLTHYGIEAKALTSYHSHSDTKKAESLVIQLLE